MASSYRCAWNRTHDTRSPETTNGSNSRPRWTQVRASSVRPWHDSHYHLGHGGLPRISQTRHHNRFSVERHCQPDNWEWKQRPVRDDSADIDASGLRHWRKRSPVFEHDNGLRRTRNQPFRAAGYPWRRT
jgi:hypothetical protein